MSRDEQINERLCRLWSLIHGKPSAANRKSTTSYVQPDARVIAHLRSNMEKLARHLKGSVCLSNDTSPKSSDGEDQWELSPEADDVVPISPEADEVVPTRNQNALLRNTKTTNEEEPENIRTVRVTSIKGLITGCWRMIPSHPYSNLQRLHKKAKWPLMVSEFWRKFQFSRVSLRRHGARKLSLRFLDCPKLQLIFTIASCREPKARDIQVEYIGGTSLSTSLRLQMDIAHQLQRSFRSKNMKYVCSVRRDSTGMKLRMVMDGDNGRVLRQAVQRHFWACGEDKMLCRVTLEEEKQSDCKLGKRRSPRKNADDNYKRRPLSENAGTKYNKKSLRERAGKQYKHTSSIITKKERKSISDSDEGGYKETTGSSSSDSVSDNRFWQRVCVAMEEYRRVPSS